LTELDSQSLEIRELGPPRHTLGAIHPMDQLFGDASEQVFQFRFRDRGIDCVCHPRLLEGVVNRVEE